MKLGTKIKIVKTVAKAGIMFGPFGTVKKLHAVYEISKLIRKVI